MKPVIRPAVAADREAVASLDLACFGEAAWSPASWVDEFARAGDSRAILVADQGGLLGYLVLMLPAKNGDRGGPDDPADLTRIGIAQAARRTGVGGRLLAAALEQLAGRPVLLEVAEGNHAALGLYRRSGFTEISRRRGYYPGGEDALILRWHGGVRD